jgi:hypothetical protein
VPRASLSQSGIVGLPLTIACTPTKRAHLLVKRFVQPWKNSLLDHIAKLMVTLPDFATLVLVTPATLILHHPLISRPQTKTATTVAESRVTMIRQVRPATERPRCTFTCQYASSLGYTRQCGCPYATPSLFNASKKSRIPQNEHLYKYNSYRGNQNPRIVGGLDRCSFRTRYHTQVPEISANPKNTAHQINAYHVPRSGKSRLEKPTWMPNSPEVGITQFCLFTSQ